MATPVPNGEKIMTEEEIENLIYRLDVSLRNDWGVTKDERSRMRALLYESRDAIRKLSNEKQQPVRKVPVRPDAG
jgi:hypothetical protein